MKTHNQSCRPGNRVYSFMLRCGIGAWRSVALLFTCSALTAFALEQRFTAYVDTDSNAAMGCSEFVKLGN
jgi:hypothetical protein